jgi:preprotein translocase subunit SecG
MYQLILLLHIIVAITIVGLVLIQHGKGADIGASFGAGASNTLFGSQGTGSFLFKLTGGLVLTFFVTSLSLSSMIAHQYQKAESAAIPHVPTVPKLPIPIPQPSNELNQ